MSRRFPEPRPWMFVAFAAAMIGLMLASFVVGAYFEARTYERLTGREVSTWDALWVELRIDDD